MWQCVAVGVAECVAVGDGLSNLCWDGTWMCCSGAHGSGVLQCAAKCAATCCSVLQ